MKNSPSLVRFFTVTLAAASVALVGCGTLDEGEGAEYPQAGQAGQYTQVAAVPASSLDALPPREPTDIAIGEDTTQYPETDPAALTQFKPTLDPVGTWYDDATYGTVWSPSPTVVGASFTPYVSAGHWSYDDDYVWVSDYDWGWAPFHYGRWVFIDGRGWSWIPGRRYAGAWVTWRTGPVGYGYVGWAPLAPSWYWRGGYAYGLYSVPSPRWSYCGTGDVFAPVVASRVLPAEATPAIASATRPYVHATPGVTGSGRIAAHPDIVGPPPTRLGINGAVPRAPVGVGGADPAGRGLAQARSLARPPIATAQPQVQRFPTANGQVLQGSRQGPLPEIGPRATTPRYSASPGTTYRSSPSYGASPPSWGQRAAPTFRSSPSFGAGGSAPVYRSSPSFGGGGSAPVYRSSPSFGHGSASPTFRSSPSFGGGGGGGGGGGTYRSSPSFGAGGGSRPSTHSAPIHMGRGGRR